MELIIASLILALALVIAAKEKSKWAIKPKRALAQITVIGPTERGEETFQLTGTLFEDESEADIDAKIGILTAIRERRVAFCNKRMMDLMDNKEEILEEAKKVMADSGISIVENS